MTASQKEGLADTSDHTLEPLEPLVLVALCF